MGVCTIDGCTSPAKTRGWCNKHYLRWWNYGDPLADNRHQPLQLQWLMTLVDAVSDECIDWPFASQSNGYGNVNIDGQNRGAHRVICELVHGPATGSVEAAHHCGRRICVNPRHIRWATRSENEGDKLIHGRDNRGERYGAHKLTEADVREIRRLWGAGAERWTQRGLSGRFGVKQSTISGIVNRHSWGWLE